MDFFTFIFCANFIRTQSSIDIESEGNTIVYQSLIGVFVVNLIKIIISPIYILILLFSKRIDFKGKDYRVRIYSFCLIIKFIFMFIHFIISIIFLAGNDQYCKTTLDKIENDELMEDVYKSLYLLWSYLIFHNCFYWIFAICVVLLLRFPHELKLKN